MAIRLCVVGPGRVGMALGKRWAARGIELCGFLGRRPEAAAAAVRFCGAGAVLSVRDLARAHVVVFAVGDAELAEAIASCGKAAAPLRACSLWLHTSGRHGLEVLAPLQQEPVRRGALHPVCPFPTAEQGLENLAGRPAVLLDGGRAERLLRRLAEALSMHPMLASPDGDRALYHAACAMAANGLTALFSLCEQLLAGARVLPPGPARQLVFELMQAALGACARHGAAAALSGPVLRGDGDTLAAHLQALARSQPEALPAYVALQQLALQLAAERGLSPAQQQALRQLLQQGGR